LQSVCGTASRPGTGPRPFKLLLVVAAGPIGAWIAVIAGQAGAWPVIVPPSDPAGLLTVLVLAPVLEEIVFRGGLQPWLERRGIGQWQPLPGIDSAVLLTSIAFAISHLTHAPPLLAAATLVPSMLLGLTQQWHKRLLVTISIHAWFNACILFSGGHLLPRDATPPQAWSSQWESSELGMVTSQC